MHKLILKVIQHTICRPKCLWWESSGPSFLRAWFIPTSLPVKVNCYKTSSLIIINVCRKTAFLVHNVCPFSNTYYTSFNNLMLIYLIGYAIQKVCPGFLNMRVGVSWANSHNAHESWIINQSTAYQHHCSVLLFSCLSKIWSTLASV